MRTFWNTDRMYSQHGQRITAELKDGKVYFKDHDRGIDGVITRELPRLPLNTAERLQSFVMTAYDLYEYQYDITGTSGNLSIDKE